MSKSAEPVIIGLSEWVALPDLGVVGLRAKIDTGASTAALHATEVQPLMRGKERWVRFTVHLGTMVQSRHRPCEAPLVAKKTIRSSNGIAQTRYVIRTLLALGECQWPVEFTLACRKSMRYRMLLGSKALIDGGLLVNPAVSYAQAKPQLSLTPASGAQ